MAVPPETQLAWFAAALDELEAFLLSRQTFWPLRDAPHGMKQDLSLGGILLGRDALQASEGELSEPARAEWSRLRTRWETERIRHAAAIERKAAAELPLRVNLWRGYLSDLAEKPEEERSYPVEVRNRVIIEGLAELLGHRSGAGTVPLERLDEALRKWLAPGSFVWPEVLRSGYPQGRYWYLYGQPELGRILANPLQP